MFDLIKIVAAFFLPPLAVFLHDGVTASFWINILLTLLAYFPGLIHALVVLMSKE